MPASIDAWNRTPLSRRRSSDREFCDTVVSRIPDDHPDITILVDTTVGESARPILVDCNLLVTACTYDRAAVGSIGSG